MQTFDETLDPNEAKDFYYNAAPAMPSGEAIGAMPVVAFVAANGVSCPVVSYSGKTVRMRLTGGIPGATSTFTLTITGDASPPTVLEVGLAVNVVDSIIGPVAETPTEALTRYIAEARARRHDVIMGEAVISIWKGGKRMEVKVASLEQLNAYITAMERELHALTATAAGKPRRRAIGVYF